MENIISYEQVKFFLAYTALWGLIILDILGIGHLLFSGIKWIIRKVKEHGQKKEVSYE